MKKGTGGEFLYSRGCYHLAIKCFSKAIEINPVVQYFYRFRGSLRIKVGEYDKAEIDITQALEIDDSGFMNNRIYFIYLL